MSDHERALGYVAGIAGREEAQRAIAGKIRQDWQAAADRRFLRLAGALGLDDEDWVAWNWWFARGWFALAPPSSEGEALLARYTRLRWSAAAERVDELAEGPERGDR